MNFTCEKLLWEQTFSRVSIKHNPNVTWCVCIDVGIIALHKNTLCTGQFSGWESELVMLPVIKHDLFFCGQLYLFLYCLLAWLQVCDFIFASAIPTKINSQLEFVILKVVFSTLEWTWCIPYNSQRSYWLFLNQKERLKLKIKLNLRLATPRGATPVN